MSGFPALSADLTKSFVLLWTQYAGKPPTDARTEIRGNVVTCVLADGVGDFNRSMIASQAHDTVGGVGVGVGGVGELTAAAYKRDAVAAVVRATHQRVASFVSSHDRDTDVATEVFTLEPSFGRGAPRGESDPRAVLRPHRGPERGLAMDAGTRGPAKNRRLVELEAEARHARERYRLYRAKAYGPRLTSARRLRELERESKFAERRLNRAKAEQDPLASGR